LTPLGSAASICSKSCGPSSTGASWFSRAFGALAGVGHRLLQRLVVEITHCGGARLVADVNRHRDVAVELHHVRRDVRIGKARRRPLAAIELDLDGLGLCHVDHLSVIAFTSSREYIGKSGNRRTGEPANW
jgi:hypothetical protein